MLKTESESQTPSHEKVKIKDARIDLLVPEDDATIAVYLIEDVYIHPENCNVDNPSPLANCGMPVGAAARETGMPLDADSLHYNAPRQSHFRLRLQQIHDKPQHQAQSESPL